MGGTPPVGVADQRAAAMYVRLWLVGVRTQKHRVFPHGPEVSLEKLFNDLLIAGLAPAAYDAHFLLVGVRNLRNAADVAAAIATTPAERAREER